MQFSYVVLCKLLNKSFFCNSTKIQQLYIFTGRNEVVAKVMFLQVSVILSTGGGVSGEPPPPGTRQTPPPTRENPPPGPGRPLPEEDCSIRSMSGRYASY